MSAEPLESLEKLLGHTFRKPDLLREALTHKSYFNEMRSASAAQAPDEKEGGISSDNERLEFLGDAVLDLIVSERLVALYPLLAEGDLSKMKARIVSETTLARVARRHEIGRFLLLGRGEERTHGREKNSLLSDGLEAVIAAVYLDGGFDSARASVLRMFEEEIQHLDRRPEDADYKTDLQELCQKDFDLLPVYRVVRESGPDHQKIFEVRLTIRDEVFGVGRGRSKKEAEQQAARQALDKLGKKA